MDSPPHSSPKIVCFQNTSFTKILSIAIIAIVLLAPIAMISSLMNERKYRRNTAVEEIHDKWGKSQTVSGPFLVVPYLQEVRAIDGSTTVLAKDLYILPETLNIDSSIDAKVRYRSIYEAVVYSSSIDISGTFVIPDIRRMNLDPRFISWEEAMLVMGLTDLRGVRDSVQFQFADSSHPLTAGFRQTVIADTSLSCPLPNPFGDETNQGKKTFAISLKLDGSEQVRFLPLGTTTRVKLKANWPSPSFIGSFLPQKHDITPSGFDASWQVLSINNQFPSSWLSNSKNLMSDTAMLGNQLADSRFGVKLVSTADVYQQAERTTKYAIIFVIFTFAAFFLSELITRNRVHPIQYTLIGCAVILFYLLLLSLAEHVHFGIAFFISAVTITLLITWYTKAISKNIRFTGIVFAVLATLYLYLYVLLQLDDYALLMGTIGLLTVLSLVMFITRSFDWYSIDKGCNEQQLSIEKAAL